MMMPLHLKVTSSYSGPQLTSISPTPLAAKPSAANDSFAAWQTAAQKKGFGPRVKSICLLITLTGVCCAAPHGSWRFGQNGAILAEMSEPGVALVV
jgi:hypothetical protein